MERKLFAVIDSRSINDSTGLRKLVPDIICDKMPFELIIEVKVSGIDYTPVDVHVRELFPTINRAFVARLIVQY